MPSKEAVKKGMEAAKKAGLKVKKSSDGYMGGMKTHMKKDKKYSMGRSIQMGKRPGMMGGGMLEGEQDKVKRLYGGGKTK